MTALKKTVRTRRGVEPAGRYLRRCCESNCPLTSVRRCSASAQVAEARRRAPGSVPSPRCGPGPPRRALRRRRPPPQIVCGALRGAIRKGAFAPPGRVRGGARRGRAQGADGTFAGSYLRHRRDMLTVTTLVNTLQAALRSRASEDGFSPRGRARGADTCGP